MSFLAPRPSSHGPWKWSSSVRQSSKKLAPELPFSPNTLANPFWSKKTICSPPPSTRSSPATRPSTNIFSACSNRVPPSPKRSLSSDEFSSTLISRAAPRPVYLHRQLLPQPYGRIYRSARCCRPLRNLQRRSEPPWRGANTHPANPQGQRLYDRKSLL